MHFIVYVILRVYILSSSGISSSSSGSIYCEDEFIGVDRRGRLSGRRWQFNDRAAALGNNGRIILYYIINNVPTHARTCQPAGVRGGESSREQKRVWRGGAPGSCA